MVVFWNGRQFLFMLPSTLMARLDAAIVNSLRSRNPFPNVGRTVSNFDSARLNNKEP